jgi:hypothetical protein
MIDINGSHVRCPLLYESSQQKHKSKIWSIVIVVISIIFACCCIGIVAYMQFYTYDCLVRNDTVPLIQLELTCKTIYYGNFEIMSGPSALLIIIFYIILYKRRTFLVERFRFQHIGLPMIVSCWSKTDRFYTGILYGRIAYEVFTIFLNLRKSIFGIDITIDPTGFLTLLVKIFQVLIIGISEYFSFILFKVESFHYH